MFLPLALTATLVAAGLTPPSSRHLVMMAPASSPPSWSARVQGWTRQAQATRQWLMQHQGLSASTMATAQPATSGGQAGSFLKRVVPQTPGVNPQTPGVDPQTPGVDPQPSGVDGLTHQMMTLHHLMTTTQKTMKAAQQLSRRLHVQWLMDQHRAVHDHQVAQTDQAVLVQQWQAAEEWGPASFWQALVGARSFTGFWNRVTELGVLMQATHQAEQSSQTDATRAQRSQQRVADDVQDLVALQQVMQENTVLLKAMQQQLHTELSALSTQWSVGQAAQSWTGDASLPLTKRLARFVPLMTPIAHHLHVPVPLILAVMTVESSGHAQVVSSAGAVGLMQVEPGTAAGWGISPQALRIPATNLLAGCLTLSSLMHEYGGQLPLVLSAYNAGPGAVARAHGQVAPGTETYVATVMHWYQTYQHHPVAGS